MLELLQDNPGSAYWMALALCAGLSLAVSLVLVWTKHHHGHLTLDHTEGVQKVHHHPTPRVGGLGIYLGLAVAWYALPPSEMRLLLGVALAAGLPALLAGLAEDVTRRVGVLPRLLATMLSGLVACLISGMALHRLDVPLFDEVLRFWPLAVAFTAFAVGGVANSINIIDGFHGLASGTVLLALGALGLLAWGQGDVALAQVCWLAAAALAGFWFVNYPWGKIFLGDGGAYFAGFLLAWLAVLLPMRNPGVSPWASLVVCAYPFIEVIYSIVRRMLARQSPGAPDRHHLHSLIARLLAHHRLPLHWQNAAVAPLIWGFVAALAGVSIALHDNTVWLAASIAGASFAYHLTYRYLASTLRRQSLL